MDDLIKRENAVRLCQNEGKYSLAAMMDDPEIVPSECGWNPFPEKWPEIGVRVLCACRGNIYDVLKLTPDGWVYDLEHIYLLGFVKAWRPLPEAYKGGPT